MNTRRRLLMAAGALGGMAALAAGWSVGWLKPGSEAGSDASETLFALRLPDAAGQDTALAHWRGRPLVLNFWASWCIPCVDEMPEFDRLHKEYADRGIGFIGIAVDTAEAVAGFQAKHGIGYPLLVAGASGAGLARAFGDEAGGLPFTAVIDRRGIVRYTKLGRLAGARLREMIESVLAGPAAARTAIGQIAENRGTIAALENRSGNAP